MIRPATLVTLLALFVVPAPARAADDPLARLAWMAGSWASDSAGLHMEEHWTAPEGGLMVGMHRDVKNGRAVSFEFLRITADTAGVAYLSSPGGRPVTRFGLKTQADRSVVFENAAHDFPQRILYWLDGKGRLHARIEGTIGGRTESEEWTWRPSGLAAR
jgi:hypothetical protein